MVVLSNLKHHAMSQPLVFIDGDQGTTGLQLLDRLRPRTDLRLLTLPDAERRDPARRAEALNACDVALLCLPDDAARAAVALVRRPRWEPRGLARTRWGERHGIPDRGAGPGSGQRMKPSAGV